MASKHKDSKGERKRQNEEIKKRKSGQSAPNTKERTSPGELHKVQ